MKRLASPLFIVVLITLLGCSTTKPNVEKTSFVFSLQENVYKITSLNTESGEGSNFLASVKDSEYGIWKAKDINQDGEIDIILNGSATLEVANQIYWSGIERAKNNGQFKSRYALRSYEVITVEKILTIRSYLINNSIPTNMFIVFDKLTNSEAILVDSTADGILDRIEKGIIEIEDAQKLYATTLEKGIKENRIRLIEKVYLVKEYSVNELLSKN